MHDINVLESCIKECEEDILNPVTSNSCSKCYCSEIRGNRKTLDKLYTELAKIRHSGGSNE